MTMEGFREGIEAAINASPEEKKRLLDEMEKALEAAVAQEAADAMTSPENSRKKVTILMDIDFAKKGDRRQSITLRHRKKDNQPETTIHYFTEKDFSEAWHSLPNKCEIYASDIVDSVGELRDEYDCEQWIKDVCHKIYREAIGE